MALFHWAKVTFGLASGQTLATPMGGPTVSPALSTVVTGGFVTDPTDVISCQSVSFDLSINPGANAVSGTLQVQGSNGQDGGNGPGGAQPGPNWYASGESAAVNLTANTPGAFNLINWPFPYRYVRVLWTLTSGGTTATMTGKTTHKGISIG